jgi:hypothetical protein
LSESRLNERRFLGVPFCLFFGIYHLQ